MAIDLEWTTRALFDKRGGPTGVPMRCSVCRHEVTEYLTATGYGRDEQVSIGICKTCLATVRVARDPGAGT